MKTPAVPGSARNQEHKNPRLRKTFLNRNMSLVLLSFFLGFLSVALFFLFPLFLENFQPSKSRVGLIMGIHSVMAIMVRPFIGRTLDARGGRKVAMTGILLMVAVVPLFHLVEDAGFLVLLLRALSGVGWGIAMTATMAMCSDLAPSDRMAQSLGIIGVAGIIAGAIGPTLTEEIARTYGFGAVFNLSMILLVAALLCMTAAKESQRPKSLVLSTRIPGLGEYSLGILIVIAIMTILHGAIRGAIINFIALFGTSVGFGRVGPFFLAFSVAAIFTRLGFGDISDRYGRKRVIFPAACLIGLNLFWIAQVESYWVFVVSGFVAGLGQGLIFPALSTYIIDFLGAENKGLALGLYLSFFDVGMGLGSPFFGWISDMGGYRRMYAVGGSMLLLWTIVFALKAPATASSDVSHQSSYGIR
jgi:MFS family permease